MWALLRQQGMAKIFDGNVPSISSMKGRNELKEKAHNAILLFLSDGVLREVVDKETTVGLWKKLKSLCMKKSFTNQLYLKQG
jgi:hypothetical protein